jgi:hypothetical protein
MANNPANNFAKKLVYDFKSLSHHLIPDDESGYFTLSKMVQLWNIAEEHDFVGYKSIFTKTKIKHFKEGIKEIGSLSKSIYFIINKAESLCSDDDNDKKLIDYLSENNEEHILTLSSKLTQLLEVYYFANFYTPLLDLIDLTLEARKHKGEIDDSKKSIMLKSLKSATFVLRNPDAFDQLQEMYSFKTQQSICIDTRNIIHHLRSSPNHGKSARMIDQIDPEMNYKDRMKLVEEYMDEMNKLHYNFCIVAIVQNEKKKNGEIWEVHADAPGTEGAHFFSANKSLGAACVSAYEIAKDYSELYATPIKFIELRDEDD